MLGENYSLTGSDVDLRGTKIALVVERNDPKALERVKVRVLGVHDMDNLDELNCIWAHHIAPSKSSSGDIPDVGDFIYVEFPDLSDPMFCLWKGFVRTLKG